MMKFKFILITIISSLNIAYGQNKYEFEFIDEGIFSPCENYPNNYIDKLYDLTNLAIEINEEGSLVLTGYVTLTSAVNQPLPLSIEAFKMERGKWQPTVYSVKRDDACTAFFNKAEMWHPYLANTPKEELKCPFTAGQRVNFDVNEPTYLLLPVRNAEGEYKLRATVGSKNGGLFVCADAFAMLHKM